MTGNPVIINKLTIIGVGLIGGSLARALRRVNAVTTLVGAGRHREQLEIARKLGVVDSVETDLASACQGSDVVVLAVPLGSIRPVLEQIAPALSAETIITDVGSAKGSVVADADQVFDGVPANFVPGHPIAGTEQSGVEASFAELFEHRRVILTPDTTTSPAAVQTVRGLWEAAGADVVEMSVAHHDAVLAATSHLPHMLAYALVDSLARQDDSPEIFDYAAGGFRDFTRIASSDPQMWHDICLANRDALVESLERFTTDLHTLTEAIRRQDSQRLLEIFRHAKQRRDDFCQ